MNQKENEIALLKSLKNDDVKAFDQLFSDYGNRVYHFSLGYLKSSADAEEVVQEVFLRIWKNRGTLKPELSFKAYLFKIAYHQILEYFEKANQQRTFKDRLIEESINFTDELDEKVNYQMLLEKVEQFIEQLPERQKVILVKKRKEGLPVKEIAVQLGISPKTVESHLAAALKNIKKHLGGKNISAMLFFCLFIKP